MELCTYTHGAVCESTRGSKKKKKKKKKKEADQQQRGKETNKGLKCAEDEKTGRSERDEG